MASKILIIDDEKNILTTLKQALELEGYDVSITDTGEKGLGLVQSQIYDLVLLDLILPGIDGIEVLKRIKNYNENIPVIMMSGHGTIKQALEATRLGAYDFIEKPISADKAALRIRNVIELCSLSESNRNLRNEISSKYQILGNSKAIKDLLEKVDRAAPSKGRVLITGESGSGKELVARRIHNLSERSRKPFVKVNCAAIPSELIESELFGHKKGAFTGAIADREGKFKKADGGTLFLDEIGDMKLEMQAKLLRVLQEGDFEPVGSEKTITVDVRVIAATNRNLLEQIEKKEFREDLYYRLNVIPLEVPPLRERTEDIPLLAESFIKEFCEENNKKLKILEQDALNLLIKKQWQGNVRQLRNLCEQIVILVPDEKVTARELKPVLELKEDVKPTVHVSLNNEFSLKEMTDEAEKNIILHYLNKNNWNMSSTAEELKLERSHLYKKCKALGIDY